MVKKYYPGETKAERKARKLREKATGKKDPSHSRQRQCGNQKSSAHKKKSRLQ